MKETAKALLSPHYILKNENKDVIKLEEDKTKDSSQNKKIPTYCVVFKARLNNNFFKQDAIDIVGDIMKELCPNAKVEYKNPDLAIVFEVMKSHCCLSVLPNYYGYKKYNLIELASATSTPGEEECKNTSSCQVTEGVL